MITRCSPRRVFRSLEEAGLIVIEKTIEPKRTLTTASLTDQGHQISRSTGERVRHQKVLESSVEKYSDGPAVSLEVRRSQSANTMFTAV